MDREIEPYLVRTVTRDSFMEALYRELPQMRHISVFKHLGPSSALTALKEMGFKVDEQFVNAEDYDDEGTNSVLRSAALSLGRDLFIISDSSYSRYNGPFYIESGHIGDFFDEEIYFASEGDLLCFTTQPMDHVLIFHHQGFLYHCSLQAE